MKKLKRLVALLLVGVVGLSGCGKSSSGTNKDDGSKKLTKVSMGIPNSGVSSIAQAVAYAAGYFEEEGIEADMVPIQSTADGLAALSTGKITWYAGGGTVAPFVSDESGEDFVVVSGEMTEGAALVALPEQAKELAKLDEEHLKGKKFGTTRTTTGDIAFRYYLQQKGISLDNIEFIEFADANSVIQAVLKGEVDFGNVFTTFRQAAEAEGLEIVAHVDDYFPGAPCCRTWVRKQDLDENRDLYVRLVRAQIKGYRVYKNDHEQAIKLGKKYIEVSDDIFEEQLYNYGHLGVSPNPDKKATVNFYNTAVKSGFADGSIDVNQFIDTSIFKDAIESLLKEEPDDAVYKELYDEFNASL